jgi:RraA family protein
MVLPYTYWSISTFRTYSIIKSSFLDGGYEVTNLGFRILPLVNRPGTNLIEQFKTLSTPLISDNMNRMHGISGNIRNFHKEGKLAGPAFTVKTRPGDNLIVHKAIELAEEGDVIMVDAGGEIQNAIIGEIMVRLAEAKGISGFVIDGAIRDTGVIGKESFPVYARGVTHKGPYKEGPGEINVPISVGGSVVMPGDIIFGDEDGLVAIPLKHAGIILEKAQLQRLKERQILCSIETGDLDRAWIDKVLIEKGHTL